MPFILLTNDDGIHAPGLPAFAGALSRLGEVEVVVPDQERSWIGKAITRFEPVVVEQVSVEGINMHTTTGYPADCVQLGVHALFGRRPDVVVSGINVGYNHGAAYLQSSGTVGAALEGMIAGVTSLAFSTGISNRPWAEWKEWAESGDSASMWSRLAVVATTMVEQVLGKGLRGAVSIGLPDDATVQTERRITTVAQVGYDRLFAETAPGVYRHTFGGLVEHREDLAGTDIEAALQDAVAITPVHGAGFSEQARPLAEALVR